MRPWHVRHHHTVTVTVHRYAPGPPDRHGNPVPAWDAGVPVPGCVLAPQTGSEPVEAGRDAVITTATLYAPPGTAIGAQDHVTTSDGTLWDVDGPPQVWDRNPFTRSPGGVAAALRRVEG